MIFQSHSRTRSASPSPSTKTMVGRGSCRADGEEVVDPKPDADPSDAPAIADDFDASFLLDSDDDRENSLVPPPLLRRRERAAAPANLLFCIFEAVVKGRVRPLKNYACGRGRHALSISLTFTLFVVSPKGSSLLSLSALQSLQARTVFFLEPRFDARFCLS